MKHTEAEHGDLSLLRRAEREIHEFALKIDAIQKETNEQASIKSQLQGDHSHYSQPPIDTTTKAVFLYVGLILKRNFDFDVNRRFGAT